MKIRIKDNFIRFRVAQKEVEVLQEEKKLLREVEFGNTFPSFQYGIEISSSIHELQVSYREHTILVHIPEDTANQWLTTDQVGFEHTISLANEKSLLVLIEKDFQCLHKRPHEDESDNFPHPLKDQP